MADEHHEDHGNTVAAWFLTLSWIVLWSVAGVAIILGGDLMLWTAVGLGGSVVFAVIAGVMKKAGLGRKTPRPVPPTREEWEALQAKAKKTAKEAVKEVKDAVTADGGHGRDGAKDDSADSAAPAGSAAASAGETAGSSR
ncbi:HGxxPAAW family protein [Streptomonospora nanhaiensis]|uniref:Uncharacterized protein n=1 Tax=Streptomonospora nanhaiensis TaxID=1323731 RepID=A0A853BJP9_9ACTN|nr:HGxxPAAW family protein [Streptomonospora nanhaiensis]MBV2362546.1 hypothetical protein [Streptomonospora nanhaiensis]MBX9391034.1 hypothetical protein [Streptomonospora nanhaiensis]NYI94792.1 hypothetical protein [Streptomonospora nanhaiensis]